jgi:glycosyltransferase involved in cell wall biosynthesis
MPEAAGGPCAAVIPCFNAGVRVRPVAAGALRAASRVILVDDGSTDGCAEALRDLPLEIIRHAANRGKGHAILSGLRAALQDEATQEVVLLDADGQHDPGEIPRLLAARRALQADLVIGSRAFAEGVPLRSRFGNVITIGVTRLLLRHHLPDTQSGFRVLSRRFAASVLESVPGGRYETEMEMIVKAVCEGWTVVPVPIRTIYEAGNASSHFRRISDSWRIYRRLFAAIRRYPRGAGPVSP